MTRFQTTRNMKPNFVAIAKPKAGVVSCIATIMLFGLLGTVSISLAEEGTWERKADMPTPRLTLTTSAVDGKIYAIGGHDYTNVLNTVEMYDPATDIWEQKADMPTARIRLSSSVVDGIIYVFRKSSGASPKFLQFGY